MNQPSRDDIEELNRISGDNSLLKLTGERGARQHALAKYFLANPSTPREIAFAGWEDDVGKHITEREVEENYSAYMNAKIERRSGAADILADVGILDEIRKDTYVLGDEEMQRTVSFRYRD